jgi:hypothetical protein
MAHVQAQSEVGAVDVADCAVRRAIKAAMDLLDNIPNPGRVGALGEL